MRSLPLTPLDIHNQEFGHAFRGYDEDEVNEFLDRVIRDYEQVLREKHDLEERNAELEERLRHYANLEEALQKTLIVAQQTADDVRNNANKEAQLVIREAEKNANRIVNEALAKSREITMEAENVRRSAAAFKARFHALLKAQLELLESQEWEEITAEAAATDESSASLPEG